MLKRLAIIFLFLLLLIPVVLAQTGLIDPDAEEEADTSVTVIPAPQSNANITYEEALATQTYATEIASPPHWATGETLAFVSVNRANLRSQPDVEAGLVVDIAIWGERYPIVGVYYPGESTVREPESDDFVFDDEGEREIWYLIDVNGGAAWIFGGLVIVANPETLDAFENRNLTAEQQAYIDAQIEFASNTVAMRYTGRLRSGPSTNTSQVGIIPFGSRIYIVGRNPYSTWFYVDYDGTRGWVSGSVLIIPNGFDATAVPIVQ